jgi:hypothetical protein
MEWQHSTGVLAASKLRGGGDLSQTLGNWLEATRPGTAAITLRCCAKRPQSPA